MLSVGVTYILVVLLVLGTIMLPVLVGGNFGNSEFFFFLSDLVCGDPVGLFRVEFVRIVFVVEQGSVWVKGTVCYVLLLGCGIGVLLAHFVIDCWVSYFFKWGLRVWIFYVGSPSSSRQREKIESVRILTALRMVSSFCFL